MGQGQLQHSWCPLQAQPCWQAAPSFFLPLCTNLSREVTSKAVSVPVLLWDSSFSCAGAQSHPLHLPLVTWEHACQSISCPSLKVEPQGQGCLMSGPGFPGQSQHFWLSWKRSFSKRHSDLIWVLAAMADSSHPREAALVVNHSLPEVCTSLPVWTCPTLLSAPASCPAMEFRKVPLLKGVSQRVKILFAAAKTNCSDSPELPGQGVTGPDGPAVQELLALATARSNLSSGAWSWMSRESTGLKKLLPEPLLYANPSMGWDKPAMSTKEGLGEPGGLVSQWGHSQGRTEPEAEPLHSLSASSSSSSAQSWSSSMATCPGISTQTLAASSWPDDFCQCLLERRKKWGF